MAVRIPDRRRATAGRRIARLMAASTLCLAPWLTALPAAAQNATWLANPGSGNFFDAGNWNPNAVPTGTALFGASATTALSLATGGSFSGWTFNAGASAYTFDVTLPQQFTGAGIVILGGSLAITNATTMSFTGTSTAGTAQLINNAVGAVFDVSGSTGPNSDHKLSAGSIAGNGTFSLGANALTVGGNNLSTTVSGVIADGGASGGTGASLVKTGTGTLTLTGANSYTGGTTISAGSLQIGNGGTTGSILGDVANNGTLIFNRSDAINFGGAISGTGAVEQAGSGTLTLSGSHSYSGATRILNGTLQADPAGAFSSASDFTVAAGARLDLNDSFQFIGSLSGAGAVTNSGASTAILVVGGSSVSTSFSGSIADGVAGTVALWVGTSGTSGTFTLTGNNTYSGGTAICACWALQIGDGGTTGSIVGDVRNGGTLIFNRSNAYSFGGVISDDNTDRGKVVQAGSGTTTLTGTNTYSGGNTLRAGTLSVGSEANLGDVAGGLTFNGGTLQITGTGFTSTTRAISWGAAGGSFDIADPANVFTLTQALSGSGGLTKAGAGTLLLSGLNTYTGATNVAAGTLRQGASGAFAAASAYMIAAGATLDLASFAASIGSLAGAGSVLLGSATLTTGADNSSTLFSGSISGSGGLAKTGSGRLNLTGISSYGGATTLNSGTLSVNGSIANSAVTVNAGATLGGNGTVGSTTLNGGKLAPGNSIGTLNVNGNLLFTAAATYMVEIDGSNSDRTNVSGTATLGGATVAATFAPGSQVVRRYTILTASGGIVGSFGAVVASNLPGNFRSSLSYTAINAYLDLTLDYTPTSSTPSGTPNSNLDTNRTNVANALSNYFGRAGSIPLLFGALDPAGLTAVSGETGTGAQQSTFEAMNLFLGLLTDPFVGNRGGGVATDIARSAFAAEAPAGSATGRGRSASERSAQALMTDGLISKAAPSPVARFEPHWRSWTAGFGGTQTTDGNAALGSSTTTTRMAAGAAGADYRFSPTTLAGFALAGGGTSFGVNGAGSGRSDLFQAGAFLRHEVGSAYVTAAAAYGWQDVTTERALGLERMQARFNVNAWSGRAEVGSRYATAWAGLTPYVAGQFTSYDAPAYAERTLGGSGIFALAYDAASVTASRSELGLRVDRTWAVADAVLTLRGRAAWAHNFNTGRAIPATFQALPGASFVVNGASPAGDAALASAATEMTFSNGIALAATLEGELSDVTRSLAAKGVARYSW
ncbi:MAG: autotransporter domain-containing protein [Rhodopseudomonas palustris]|uniref:Autotransporter domain-containing protein n=1 Tax=Rhodopseudomonas palustris TaxID=1076 RepID=A0A933S582_RHOPL|nr:autotransporter domain-containing protein [Rhodopseudomonas palustris]